MSHLLAAVTLCSAMVLSCCIETCGIARVSVCGARLRGRCSADTGATPHELWPLTTHMGLRGGSLDDSRPDGPLSARRAALRQQQQQNHKGITDGDGCQFGTQLPPRLVDLTHTPKRVAALARSIQRQSKKLERRVPKRSSRCEYIDTETSIACRKRPCFALPGSIPALRCARHRKEGDVDVVNPACQFAQGCSKTATFGGADTCWRRAYCTAHRRREHENILLCARRTRRALPAVTTVAPVKTAQETGDFQRGLNVTLVDVGEEDVMGKGKEEEGKILTGHLSQMPPQHGKQFAADAKNVQWHQLLPVCGWKGADGDSDHSCWRRATYVSSGGADDVADRCAFHRTDGMPLATPICTYSPEASSLSANSSSPGKRDMRCRRRASYGVRDEAAGWSVVRPLFCSLHRLPEHRSVHSRWCRADGCLKAASYGRKGRSPHHCSRHKTDGDVNLRHGCCRAPRCAKSANYGPVAGHGIYCARHKAPEHVNLAQRRGLLDKCLALVPPAARAALQRMSQVYLHRGRDAKASVRQRRVGPEGADGGGADGGGEGGRQARDHSDNHEQILGRSAFWSRIERELQQHRLVPLDPKPVS